MSGESCHELSKARILSLEFIPPGPAVSFPQDISGLWAIPGGMALLCRESHATSCLRQRHCLWSSFHRVLPCPSRRTSQDSGQYPVEWHFDVGRVMLRVVLSKDIVLGVHSTESCRILPAGHLRTLGNTRLNVTLMSGGSCYELSA